MKKNILLLVSLFVSGINAFADDNVVVDNTVHSVPVEQYVVQIMPENQAKEELELTWDEKSVIRSLHNLYQNK